MSLISSRSDMIQFDKFYPFYHFHPARSHCTVEWNEPGNPTNVVPMKNVKQRDGSSVEVSKLYDVEISVRPNKRSLFQAKILGIGMQLPYFKTNTLM